MEGDPHENLISKRQEVLEKLKKATSIVSKYQKKANK
jgi:hypothetical protein